MENIKTALDHKKAKFLKIFKGGKMEKKKPLVVNFFGSPGAGKSTLAASVFAKLKMNGISCELVDEYVKGAVWEDRLKIIQNQLYLFGKQFNKLARIGNNVDIIITDSPIVLGIYYNRLNSPKFDFNEKVFAPLVLECHNYYKNINVLVKQHFKYDTKGRYQTEEQAISMEKEIEQMYQQYNLPYIKTISSEKTANLIATSLIDFVKKHKV